MARSASPVLEAGDRLEPGSRTVKEHVEQKLLAVGKIVGDVATSEYPILETRDRAQVVVKKINERRASKDPSLEEKLAEAQRWTPRFRKVSFQSDLIQSC